MDRSEELLGESLVYERAWSMLSSTLSKLRSEKDLHIKEKRAAKEEPDKAYEIVCDALQSLADELRDYSDKLYEESRKCRVPFKPAYYNLLNAIVTKGAEDYELALSGCQCESELEQIEQFADILGIRAKNILERLRKNHVEFCRVAKRDADAIIEETKRNRQRGVGLENNKHKCPNCGGSLYSVKDTGAHRIYCTRCYFFETVKNHD